MPFEIDYGYKWLWINNNGTFNLLQDFAFTVSSAVGHKLIPQNPVTIPYGLQPGSSLQKVTTPERIIRLEGHFDPDHLTQPGTYEALLENERAFENQLVGNAIRTYDSSGKEVYTLPILRFQLFDGRYIQIKCTYRTGMEGGALTGFSEDVMLEFIAPEVYWYHPTEILQSLNINSNTIVNNAGDAESYPRLTLEGEGVILALANSTQGITITFNNFSLAPSETAILDLQNRPPSMSSNLRPNMNGLIGQSARLTTWQLLPGDNILLLTAQGEDILLDEDGEALLDENGQNLLASNTLNITKAELSWLKRYNSINGVVAT